MKKDYGRNEAFYQMAQTVSETLPKESKEKKLLDGFLSWKEQIKQVVRKSSTQRKLG